MKMIDRKPMGEYLQRRNYMRGSMVSKGTGLA